jgi:hypothetical protein
MRDKDQLILEQAYSNLKLVKEERDDVYTCQVALDVMQDSYSQDQVSLEDYNVKVTVKYRMELDIRSWGLKDISIISFEVDPFTLDWDWDDHFNGGEKPKPLHFEKLNTSDIPIELKKDEHGNVVFHTPFYPTTLELHLDKNNQVIPSKSRLVF